MIFIPNLGELEGFCQGILSLLNFWGQFLREIGCFKILEIAVSPEPAGSPELVEGSKGQRVTRFRSGTLL